MTEDLLTLAEAAIRLGITPDTLRQSIARGAFAARKFGNTWVTTSSEVDRYAAHRAARYPGDWSGEAAE